MSIYKGNIEINNIYVGTTQISNAYVGSSQIYGGGSVSVDGVMFTAKQSNSTIGLASISTGQTIEYSTDGNTWTNMTTSTTITLTNSGDSVYVRGVLSSNNSGSNYTKFTMSGNIKASGNINYLWDKDNPDAALKQFCGYALFNGCTALSDISELELPATTLANYCYYNMFYACTSLTTAPELPATTLADSCYQSMFQSCISLTEVPELPATTLAGVCYAYMFYGCTSLTSAPELPATTLAVSCYLQMFMGCTSLTSAPALPATTLARYCYQEMFYGCTSLTSAPELPATTLTIGCYQEMFYACTNLNYIKCLATNISATYCTKNWVNGVAASGTFVKNASMTGWTTGTDGIPSGWTITDIDFTKKNWWTSNSGSYNFNLPTRLNNGYYVEVDQYITDTLSYEGNYFVLNNNENSPLEVFYFGNNWINWFRYIFDAHYPNSTTAATVNTTDYDHRVLIENIGSVITTNIKYTFKYQMTPTHGLWIYSGDTQVTGVTASVGNKDYCTSEDYPLHISAFPNKSGYMVLGDVRIYDDNNTLIHNFQLYQNPNSNNEYQYLDRITSTWYPVVDGSITKVETTDR